MTKLDTLWDAYGHLTHVQYRLETFGRPRKHPGRNRPLAVNEDGVEYRKNQIDYYSAIERISLPGAFIWTSKSFGRSGIKMAQDLVISKYYAGNQNWSIEDIDFYESDTREIVRTIKRAKRVLLAQINERQA